MSLNSINETIDEDSENNEECGELFELDDDLFDDKESPQRPQRSDPCEKPPAIPNAAPQAVRREPQAITAIKMDFNLLSDIKRFGNHLCTIYVYYKIFSLDSDSELSL